MSINYRTVSPDSIEKQVTPQIQPARQVQAGNVEAQKYFGKMCMTADQPGYIGESSCRKFPKHVRDFFNDMTLEDGSPLPLDPHDSFVPFYLYEISEALKKTAIRQNFVLPRALIHANTKSLKLRYKGQPIELEINQENHGLKFENRPLSKALELHDRYIETKCEFEQPMYGVYDPCWFYKPGDLYKLEKQENSYSLKQGKPSDFRQKVEPREVTCATLLNEERSALVLNLQFETFKPEDFDIILTETHLLFYACYEENRFLNAKEPDKFIQPCDGKLLQVIKDPREALFAYRWDKVSYFQDAQQKSFTKMQNCLQRSTLYFNNGILRFDLPIL